MRIDRATDALAEELGRHPLRLNRGPAWLTVEDGSTESRPCTPGARSARLPRTAGGGVADLGRDA